jgi:hypothetical protein
MLHSESFPLPTSVSGDGEAVDGGAPRGEGDSPTGTWGQTRRGQNVVEMLGYPSRSDGGAARNVLGGEGNDRPLGTTGTRPLQPNAVAVVDRRFGGCGLACGRFAGFGK